MSSKESYKKTGQYIVQRSDGNNKTNNIKAYSIKKTVVEKSITTSYNTNGNNYSNKTSNRDKSSEYQIKSNFPVIKNQTQNKNMGQSTDVKIYQYTSGNTANINSVNLKHHPNQVNNLIHNHKFYTSNTSNTQKTAKTSHTVTSTRTERSQRTQSLSPVGKNKYVVETRKVELYGKQRNSSASESSKETSVSISKSQIRKFMTNVWLEEIYCSNVESLSCLVDPQNTSRSNCSELYEKELEQKETIIKEYESQILKLKSVLNMKEQEMKKLVQNLKQSENALKVRNKRIYELNVKTASKTEALDKDTHELQIISTKQEKNPNQNLDRDAHSLQIISMKKGWNDINVPSPVNEIYIQTVLNAENYEEMRRIKKMREEKEIIRRKMEKIANFEIQEMGLLSIITKKPKKNIVCQHLESIMILSKVKLPPMKFQKIEEINITSETIKARNEIQELDGLEIIHYKKEKKLEQQCLNGLEIQREYDMLLVKPQWHSLKIQGTGLNLLAIQREVALENQEIDEIELRGKEQPEKIKVIMPVAPNKMQRINTIKMLGKVKKKPYFTINRERIRLDGEEMEEKIDWNELNMPIKTTKLLLRRNYEKVKPKKEKDWNMMIKPIKSTKLSVKGKEKKVNLLKMVKKDKFNFLHNAPVKEVEEFDIENFSVKLISPIKKVKKTLKMIRGGFNIKGEEKKKLTLIKNRMDSINLFGLIEKSILIPSSTQNVNLISKEVKKTKNWNDGNKVMRTRDLNIPKKMKAANKIIKKVVNIQIKSSKEIILKPIKANKLFIKGIIKKVEKIVKKPSFKLLREGQLFIKGIRKVEKVIKKPSLKELKQGQLSINSIQKVEKKPEIILKPIKANKLFIKGIVKKVEVEKPKIKPQISVINWNDLIEVEKKPSINIIQKVKKSVLKKQGLNAFCLRGVKKIQKKSSDKIEVVKYDWSDLIKAQRNAKFEIKGKTKKVKLSIIKGDKFLLKKEPEEEIIYNDDYNYLKQQKKENGKEKTDKEKQEKLVVIKEKEITPIVKREIRAQVIRVKEDSSETSSQSDIDVLAAIKRQKMMGFSSEIEGGQSGYYKQVINGEVIFTPKTSLGVNLGAAKYKKEFITKKGINYYNTEQNRATGIEISGNNGEIIYEKMSGIGGAIKEGSYKIVNGSASNIKVQKKLKTIYQSTNNIKNSNKLNRVPNDSKKKNMKKQFIVKYKLKTDDFDSSYNSGNMNNSNAISGSIKNEGNKKIIFNSNLTNENIKHSASTFGIRQQGGKIITMKKEETYTYEHKDNGNLVNKEE